MEWREGLVCLLVVILGIVLLLYGANYYDNFAGWAGVYLFVGGILAYVFLRIFSHLKRAVSQKP
jgi:hypothetical protein